MCTFRHFPMLPADGGVGGRGFTRDAFLCTDFDAVALVASRRDGETLTTLREELAVHLQTLNNELVELINRDYADFVRLSANMVGLDGVVRSLREPLKSLREDVLSVRSVVSVSLAAVEGKLQERRDLAAKRKALQRFIDVASSLRKVEGLLRGEKPAALLEEEGDGEEETETAASVLERVANEFNQLHFHAAGGKDAPFIRSLGTTIKTLEKTLLDRLNAEFVAGLTSQDTEVLSHCLRAYTSIGRAGDAEALFRERVVQPFVEEVMTMESLEKGSVGGFAGLVDVYESILHFVRTRCKLLLDLTGTSAGRIHGFHFLCHSVWAEVVHVLTTRLQTVFANGIPAAFHTNYVVTMQFVEQVEGFFHTRAEVIRFRDDPSYKEFMKRWNLRIFFQLRFQKVVNAVDAALADPPGEESWDGASDLVLPAAQAVWTNMSLLWSSDTFLVPLTHRFLKLSMQLLARFRSWVEQGVQSGPEGVPWGTLAPEIHVFLYHDVEALVAKTRGAHVHHVHHDNSQLASVRSILEEAFALSATGLEETLAPLLDLIVRPMVKKCEETLGASRGIIGVYRMTNKPLPTSHSFFIPNVLTPLSTFLHEHRAHLSQNAMERVIEAVLLRVTESYADMITSLFTTFRQTENSLKRFQPKKSSPHISQDTISDEEKIRTQLWLDVEEYGRQMNSLRGHSDEFEPHHRLRECVAKFREG